MNWLHSHRYKDKIFILQAIRQRLVEEWAAGRADRDRCRAVIARINQTIERLYWTGIRNQSTTRKG